MVRIGKKQKELRIGLYTLNEPVDTWLSNELSEYGVTIVPKKDNDRDITGLDAILLMELQDPVRAEQLYLFADDAIGQGIHIIWVVDGDDEWYREVSKEMQRKGQTVLIGNIDAIQLLENLIKFEEEWEYRPKETLPLELVEQPAAEEAVSLVGALDHIQFDELKEEETTQSSNKNIQVESIERELPGKKAQEDPEPIKRPARPIQTSQTVDSSRVYEKLRHRVTAIDPNAKTVVREKVIRVGTSVIALASSLPGTGSTYSAIQMGLYLRRFVKNVAVIELRDERNRKPGSLLAVAGPDRTDEDVMFHLNGIDFAYTSKPSSVMKKTYEYVVMDIGPLSFRDDEGNVTLNMHLDELERATIGCVTGTFSPWGYYELIQFLNDYRDHRNMWDILLREPSPVQLKQIKDDLGSVADDCRIHGMPYQPDPFVLEEETATVLKELLKDILPQEAAKGDKWLGLGRLLKR